MRTETLVEAAMVAIDDERYPLAWKLIAPLRLSRLPDANKQYRLLEQEIETRYRLGRSCELMESDEIERAWSTCQSIPAKGRYGEKGCCSNIAELWAKAEVQSLAELLSQGNHKLVYAVAREYHEDQGLPESARGLFARPMEKAHQALEDSMTKVERVDDSDDDFSPTASEAMEVAKQAIIAGDQHGCIRALKGAPRTNRVVMTLTSCYLSIRDIHSACRLAKAHSNTAAIRQFVFARCR